MKIYSWNSIYFIGSLMYLGTQQEAVAAENNIENPTTLKIMSNQKKWRLKK